MSKFNIGDMVVCVQGYSPFDLNVGDVYQVEKLYSDGAISINSTLPFVCYSSRFVLYDKPSLRSLYESERDKLTTQQDITTAAWELVVAEELLAQNARNALLHAKRVEVDCVRDKLKEVSARYTKVSDQLDEMLRNEPF